MVKEIYTHNIGSQAGCGMMLHTSKNMGKSSVGDVIDFFGVWKGSKGTTSEEAPGLVKLVLI